MSDGSPSPTLQIPENLVVGAILFDDVDDVLDRILAAGELDCSGIVVQQVVVLDGASEFFELAESRWNVQPRDRATQQRGNVRMIVMFDLVCGLAHAFVRARALAFGGGDEQIVAVDGEGAGVPVGGNEAESGLTRTAASIVGLRAIKSDISKTRDRVERSIGDE